MMYLLMLTGAAVLAPAQPRGNPATWVVATDLQPLSGTETYTRFDLMVNQDGRAVACQIIDKSGNDKLDASVCAALMKRARFKPAIDEKGAATAGVWSDSVRWKPRGNGTSRYILQPADLVAPLPGDLSAPKTVTVDAVALIDADASLALCTVRKKSRFEVLDAKACELVSAMDDLRPVRDQSGQPVSGVRKITVAFTNSE